MRAARESRRTPARWPFAAAVLLALFAMEPATVLAEVYKWTDEQGRVHYGDRPPPGVKTDKVEGAVTVVPTPQAAAPLGDKKPPTPDADSDRLKEENDQLRRAAKAEEDREAERRRQIDECQRNRGVDCEQEVDGESGTPGYIPPYQRPPLRPPVMPPGTSSGAPPVMTPFPPRPQPR
jgi:uncharacterized protein DUF4124